MSVCPHVTVFSSFCLLSDDNRPFLNDKTKGMYVYSVYVTVQYAV